MQRRHDNVAPYSATEIIEKTTNEDKRSDPEYFSSMRVRKCARKLVRNGLDGIESMKNLALSTKQ